MLAHALVQQQQSVYDAASRVFYENQHTLKSDMVKHVARGRVRTSLARWEQSDSRVTRQAHSPGAHDFRLSLLCRRGPCLRCLEELASYVWPRLDPVVIELLSPFLFSVQLPRGAVVVRRARSVVRAGSGVGPAKRRVYWSLSFRVGLSHAQVIDRRWAMRWVTTRRPMCRRLWLRVDGR